MFKDGEQILRVMLLDMSVRFENTSNIHIYVRNGWFLGFYIASFPQIQESILIIETKFVKKNSLQAQR